jgi:hypothetical protein
LVAGETGLIRELTALDVFPAPEERPDHPGTPALAPSGSTAQAVAPIRLALVANQAGSMSSTCAEPVKGGDVRPSVELAKVFGGCRCQ